MQIEHVATLTGHDSLGGISPTPTLVSLPTGEYAASNWFNHGGILVFDAHGRATRTVGRKGAGPGEFNAIHVLRKSGDRIFVYDRDNARISVLAADGTLVDETRLSIRASSVLPLSTGAYLAAAELHSPDEVGLPLHLIDSIGNLQKSFGDPTGAYAPGLGGVRMRRRLHSGPDGSIWSGRRGEYTFERWDTSGRLLQRLDRHARWFPPADPQARVSLEPESAPQAGLMDFNFGRDSLLWVLIEYPSNDWRNHLEPVDREFPGGITVYRPTTFEGMWTTILEIIDLRSGSVLFTRRYSPMFIGFLGEGVIYSYETRDGVGRYHVWKLTLHRP